MAAATIGAVDETSTARLDIEHTDSPRGFALSGDIDSHTAPGLAEALAGAAADSDLVVDVAQIALVERHRATGQVVNALVSGFGYRGRMAMGSTVAHDSHHMIVVGTDRGMMACAANTLAEIGGGVTVWRDGAETARVPLPIAGLMSDAPAEDVAANATRMVAAMAECGCTLNNAYMQHSLLALVVIPELRISDRGLVDVTRFQLTELIE